ncbi:hypothetical protein MMC13_004580 [Lambiella insularis]|nr:hypothetical protein [Lambiella insularis]
MLPLRRPVSLPLRSLLLYAFLPFSRAPLQRDMLFHLQHCYQSVRPDAIWATSTIRSRSAMYTMRAIWAKCALSAAITVYVSRTLVLKAHTLGLAYSRAHEQGCINKRSNGHDIVSDIVCVANDRVYKPKLIDSGRVHGDSSVGYDGGEYKCYGEQYRECTECIECGG